MAVAALFNVPATVEEINVWGFCNAAHHIDVNRAIFQLNGTNIASFVLDPIPINNPDAMSAWLYQHQQVHTTTNDLLGVSGFDLTDVNFLDKGDLAGWIWNHAQEHYQWASILLIG